MSRSRLSIYILLLLVLVVSLSCRQAIQPLEIPTFVYKSNPPTATLIPGASIGKLSYLPVVRSPDDVSIVTPTPDVARELPEIRSEDEGYIVQVGDSLESIADRFNITLQMLLAANQIISPDLIEVGQSLVIPAPILSGPGLGSKIIPDSELVYGPYAQGFDVIGFLARFDSYLNRYAEFVEGHLRTIFNKLGVGSRTEAVLYGLRKGWFGLDDTA